MYLSRTKAFALLLLITILPTLVSAASVYETQAAFLDRAFSGSPPEPGIIWLSGDRKSSVRQILGHDYPALRLRYWCAAGLSAWVVEEIGKELPITVGVIIHANYIKSLRVLTYRENRGEEVVSPAFSDQFINSTLDSSGELDKNIDGISGATLSVQALTRLATMSLFLHAKSGCQDGT
jgi:hypothetical protein